MIRAAEIRVIADDGEQLGVMTPEAAIARAEEAGLDLVEVSPAARPPVCRIMDYGRYKYEQKKKANKSKGHAASLKEVKLRPRTDQHDLDFKLKNARRFLMEGDKVKVTVMYRGREMVHRDIGRKQLDRVVELIGPISSTTRSSCLRPMSRCTISRPRYITVTLTLSPSIRKRRAFFSLKSRSC